MGDIPADVGTTRNPAKIENIVFGFVLIGAVLILISGVVSSVLASSEGPVQSFSRSAPILLLVLGSIGAVLIGLGLTVIPKYSSSVHLTREMASKLIAIISIFALPLVLLLGYVFENGAGFAPIIGMVIGLSTQIGAVFCFVGGLAAFFFANTHKNAPTKTDWIRVIVGILLGTVVGCVLEFASLIGFFLGVGQIFFLFGGIIGALIAYWIANGSTKLKVISGVVTLSLTLLFIFWILFNPPIAPDGANLGTSCIGQPGFSCSGLPVINQDGMLSFTLSQGIGQTIYDLKLACVSSANSVAIQNLTYYQVSNQSSITNGDTLDVKNLQCYPYSGSTKGMLLPIGTGFTGVIWSTYATSPEGTIQYVKIVTVAVKSSS